MGSIYQIEPILPWRLGGVAPFFISCCNISVKVSVMSNNLEVSLTFHNYIVIMQLLASFSPTSDGKEY